MMFAIAAIVLAQATAAPAQPMDMDKPIAFGKLEIACSGVGSAKDDPQWGAYPIRIEFANGAAQNLSGAHITITSGGSTVADGVCWGPWLLVRGAPGSYHVNATIDGSHTTAASNFTVGNGTRQTRVVLRFPDFQANE